MSTELINRITVKKDGVYVSSHSSKRVYGISLPSRQKHTVFMNVRCGIGCMEKFPQGAANMTEGIKIKI